MRVLVATDLSKPADEAVRQAVALAGTSGTLAAVHVLPALQAVSTLFPQRHAQDALDVARITQHVMGVVGARVATLGGRDADIFVEEGTDYAEIVRRAEAWKADVVVVGSHGHSGIARLLGGVAERVVRHAHCRVLVVREGSASGCVLAATDLSEPSLPAVAVAVEEAKRRGVPTRVVHAIDFMQVEAAYFTELGAPWTSYRAEELRDPVGEQFKDMMLKADVSAERRIIEGPAAHAILDEAAALGAQLIVVGSHGKTGLKRFLLGNVAEKIVRGASCSVLVVRFGN